MRRADDESKGDDDEERDESKDDPEDDGMELKEEYCDKLIAHAKQVNKLRYVIDDPNTSQEDVTIAGAELIDAMAEQEAWIKQLHKIYEFDDTQRSPVPSAFINTFFKDITA